MQGESPPPPDDASDGGAPVGSIEPGRAPSPQEEEQQPAVKTGANRDGEDNKHASCKDDEDGEDAAPAADGAAAAEASPGVAGPRISSSGSRHRYNPSGGTSGSVPAALPSPATAVDDEAIPSAGGNSGSGGNSSSPKGRASKGTNKRPRMLPPQAVDVETALSLLCPDELQQVVAGGCAGAGAGAGAAAGNDDDIEREMLFMRTTTTSRKSANGGGEDAESASVTTTEEVWVKFRAGHAGDASALAELCRSGSFDGNNEERLRDEEWDNNQEDGEDGKGGGGGKRDKACQDVGEQGNRAAAPVSAEADKAASESRNDGQQEVTRDGDDATNDGGSGSASEKSDAGSSIGKNGEHHHDAELAELELRLSSGFGDETTPPAFHAILAEVYHCCSFVDSNGSSSYSSGDARQPAADNGGEGNNDGTTVDLASVVENPEATRSQRATVPMKKDSTHKFLGGAAILTTEWDASRGGGRRVLRAEMVKVDPQRCEQYADLLKRRLVLRVAALGVASGCAAVEFPPIT